MDAKLALDALRLLIGLSSAIRNFTQHASKEQLAEFVAGVHAQGGSIDVAVLQDVLDDVKDSGAALDAKIAAHGG